MVISKQTRNIVGAIAAIALLAALCFFYAEHEQASKALREDATYLASSEGKLGIFNIKSKNFELLYDGIYEGIYVSMIVGVTCNDEVVFINEHFPEESNGNNKSRSLRGLYKFNLKNKQATRLDEKSSSHVYMSPNGEALAYIVYTYLNNQELVYLNLKTMESTRVSVSEGYFGRNNAWSPDSSRVAINRPGGISLFKPSNQKIYAFSSLKDQKAEFLGWFDKSHLLLKIEEYKKENMVSFNIKTEKVTYLFNKDSSIFYAACTPDHIIVLKRNPRDSHIWDVAAAPRESSQKAVYLFSVPPDLKQIPEADRLYLFFRQITPISNEKIFYQVLDCETYEPQYCGVVDLKNHTQVILDTAITSLVPFRRPQL